MGCGADLLLMRETANLSLGHAAKCLSIGGFELRLLEQRGSGITEEMMAAVRTVYYQNQRPEPIAEPVEEPYIAGTDEQEMCRHFWQVEPPDGPTSRGECRDCGASRTFRNSGDFTPGPGD